MFAGLAIGASAAGDPVWALAGAALTVQTARHASDFAWGTTRQLVIETSRQPPLSDPGDAAPAPPAARPLAQRILGNWARMDRLPGIRWVKKMIAFPIGERFAVISLTAAIWSARTTFIVLLVWGGVAVVYQHIGRLLRTVSS